MLYLLSTAVGGIVGGAFNGITSAVGGLGQTVAQTAAPIIAEANPLDAIAPSSTRARRSGPDSAFPIGPMQNRQLHSEWQTVSPQIDF